MSSHARPAVLASVVALSLVLPGCLASSMTAGESLREALDHYTDAVRWGRAASAMQHVAPRLRRAMARRHLAWARLIRIAETQVVDLNHDDAHHRATVFVQIAWYSDSDPMVRTTTLEQTWRDLDGWVLVNETVMDGDEELLAFGAPPVRATHDEDDGVATQHVDPRRREASERSSRRSSRSLSRHAADDESPAEELGWQ